MRNRIFSNRCLRVAAAFLWLVPSFLNPAWAQVDRASAQAQFDTAVEKVNRLMAALDAVDRRVDRTVFDLDALAAKLGRDPAASFRFVRDEIRYEPYYGVLRGARGTLIARAGNALDRSLLLSDLLGKAGFASEIVSGRLDDVPARALVGHLFESVRPPPAAVSAGGDLVADIVRALGVAPDKAAAVANDLKRGGAADDEALWDRVDNNSDFIASKLAEASVILPGPTPLDQLVKEAREHYWVRYRDSAEKWIDLDAAFADSEPGRSVAEATESFAPDAVPEDRYHRLGVKVTLRVAKVSGDKDQLATDTVLIDQDLRVADRQGIGINVANLPFPSSESLFSPDRQPNDALSGIQEFTTVLSVGEQVVVSKYFDLTGHLYDSAPGTDAGNAERLGKASGGGLGGAASALENLLGKGQTAQTTRIVGEWVEYRLTSLGSRGQAPESRTFRRDIVAPETVTAWVPDGPAGGTTAPTKLTKDELQRRLFWSAELLPVTSGVAPDYAGYLQLVALRESREFINSTMRRIVGLPVNSAATKAPSLYPTRTLLLAASAVDHAEKLIETRFPELRTYADRPGLIAFERSGGADQGFSEGYDIVSWPARVAAPRPGAPGVANQVAALRIANGVLQTAFEWALMSRQARAALAGGSSRTTVLNTTEVFRAAADQNVGAALLSPDAGSLRRLGGLPHPDAVKAEMATSLAAGDTVLVPIQEVTIDGKAQIGWWRIGASGEVVGIMQGGRGKAEYGLLTAEQALAAIQNAAGWVTGLMCIIGAGGYPNLAKVPVSTQLSCIIGGIGAYYGAGSYRSPLTSGIIAVVTAILALIAYELG